MSHHHANILDRADQGETCLVGTLETWPLGEMLLWLNKTGRDAMVRVGVGLDAGVLFLRGGDLYRAEWKHLSGVDALWALLNVQTGVFSLIQREVPMPQANISLPTEQLLLQFAVAQDEARRVSA